MSWYTHINGAHIYRHCITMDDLTYSNHILPQYADLSDLLKRMSLNTATRICTATEWNYAMLAYQCYLRRYYLKRAKGSKLYAVEKTYVESSGCVGPSTLASAINYYLFFLSKKAFNNSVAHRSNAVGSVVPDMTIKGPHTKC